MTVSSEMTFTNEVAINAPAEKIFNALTDPRQLVQWWGEDGVYRVTEMVRDLRVGGQWRSSGVDAEGKSFVTNGVYLAIDAPRLLEYSWHYDWDDASAETIVHFDLIEANGKTTVRITHSGFADEKARDGHKEGWFGVFAWLAKYVE